MKKTILIAGAGSTEAEISKAVAAAGYNIKDVIVVTPDNIEECKNVIMQNSPFEPEPLKITRERIDDLEIQNIKQKIPSIKELNKHPFEKFIGQRNRSKKKKKR